MRINGFRCDGCGKEHLLEPSRNIYDTYSSGVPADWFLVSHGGEERQEPLLFCSVLCCHRWSGKSLTAAYEQPDEAKV
jgi:hypothetical protein